MRRLFTTSAILASTLLATPAFADDTCPADLQEAATSLDEARAAHKEAHSDVYDTNWNGRIGRADDRDVEIALQKQAYRTLAERRRERRQARRAFRETRQAHTDATKCSASSPSSRMWTWMSGSLLGA